MQQFLQQLGRVRANDIVLRSPAGEVLYRSPPPTYKAGREAPAWFAHLLAPQQPRHTFPLPGGFSWSSRRRPPARCSMPGMT